MHLKFWESLLCLKGAQSVCAQWWENWRDHSDFERMANILTKIVQHQNMVILDELKHMGLLCCDFFCLISWVQDRMTEPRGALDLKSQDSHQNPNFTTCYLSM